MRWQQIIIASVGLLSCVSGWTNGVTAESHIAYPQEPEFNRGGYWFYPDKAPASQNISTGVDTVEYQVNIGILAGAVIKLMAGMEEGSAVIPAVGIPVTNGGNGGNGGKRAKKPVGKTLSASASASFLSPSRRLKRHKSTGGLTGFCTEIPTGGYSSIPPVAASDATYYKLPIPPMEPVEGALNIDPELAARALGDDLSNGMVNFFRQTLPGVDTGSFQSESERTALASHYRTTYGLMRPTRDSGGSVIRYAGIGEIGSIGANFRDLVSMGAEAIQNDPASKNIGKQIEDTNFFSHLVNTRRFLGRRENDRDFTLDYRRSGYQHGQYPLADQDSQEMVRGMEDTFHSLMDIVQQVVGENSQLGIDISTIGHSTFFHASESMVTVHGLPPEWIDLFIKILLYDLFKSFNSMTNQEQLLNKLGHFGAMFQFIRPFSECNELTLINLFKMATDLLLTNTGQLDFNSLVFADKKDVATPIFFSMHRAIFEARRMNGERPQPVGNSPGAPEGNTGDQQGRACSSSECAGTSGYREFKI